jgi:hypothetical protein
LIISQVKGKWQNKDEKPRLYQEYFTKLSKDFHEIKFTYLGQDNNQFAYAFATLASMIKIDWGIRGQLICIKIRNSSTYYY